MHASAGTRSMKIQENTKPKVKQGSEMIPRDYRRKINRTDAFVLVYVISIVSASLRPRFPNKILHKILLHYP